MRDTGSSYELVLPLFARWLSQFGVDQLTADTVGDEIAENIQKAEDAAYVQVKEIESLVSDWPLYQGRRIGGEDIRRWISQVESHRDQRILFKMLQSLHFYAEVEIRERLKEAHSLVRQYLPQFITKKRAQRRQDLAITYVDGQGKSGSFYATRYAETNLIAAKNVLNPNGFSDSLIELESQTGTPISAVVVVDDIAATGRSLSSNIERFVTDNENLFRSRDMPLIAVVITATAEGEETVRQSIEALPLSKSDLRVCDPLGEEAFAFGQHSTLWDNVEEADRAKALTLDIGTKIYSKQPLGYGGSGLLVVFPDTCPNNSVPLLHSSSRQGNWQPIFPRIVN